MKTTTTVRICLRMAMIILTAAITIAAALPQVPFKGTLQGHATDIGGPATSGTGIGTEMGQFSF
jgi:hypothetical protein